MQTHSRKSPSKSDHLSVKKAAPKPISRALKMLNISQFLGTLNDNIFKLFTIFTLIEVLGSSEKNTILFITGIVYILPFILFSTVGGTLADRLCRRNMIVFLKGLEIAIMSLGVIAFYYQVPILCYGLVFCMSAQSAFFGPPKLSIVPDLVERDQISKANSLLTSSVYMGAIFGSFLASEFAERSGNNYVLGAIVCVGIAILGFIASTKIPKVTITKTKTHPVPKAQFVLVDVYQTLKFCKTIPYIIISMFGSAFFLMLGSYIQLNIIPFAMESLDLTDTAGGKLFLPAALGIIVGSYLAGKTKKQRGNMGLSVVASFFTTLFFFLLSASSSSLILCVINLFMIGVSGGLMILPLDSYVQAYAPDHKRGQILATSNFLSFTAVLIAPISIELLSNRAGYTPAGGFMVMGCINAVVFLILAAFLSGHFISFLSRKIAMMFASLHITPKGFQLKSAHSLVVHARSPFPLLALFALTPRLKLYIAQEKHAWWHRIVSIVPCINILNTHGSFLLIARSFRSISSENALQNSLSCLVIPQSVLSHHIGESRFQAGIDMLRTKSTFIGYAIHRNSSLRKKKLKIFDLQLSFDPPTSSNAHLR